MILSASRSTDIPAYYGQWFMNRLRAGLVRLGESVQPPSLVCVVQGREGGRLLDEEPGALPAASGRA
ncbi:MAG: DUF1848 family protein [Sutterella wadsworthensis]